MAGGFNEGIPWAPAQRYAQADAVERALIEQAALFHVVLNHAVQQHAALTGRLSTADAAHYERRVSAAQARLNRALLALERVRALRRPRVQVNVAAAGGTFQQVNAGG